jgi:ketosteroid isomerase-like protein
MKPHDFVALALAIAWSGTGSYAQTPTQLKPNLPVERTITGTEVHAFAVTLKAGELLHFVAEQRGIDVVVTLTGPDGTKLREIDSPTGDKGVEDLSFISEAAGAYRIEVRRFAQGPNPQSGKYEAKLLEIRSATRAELDRLAEEKVLADLEPAWDEANRVVDVESLDKMTTDDYVSISSFPGQTVTGKPQSLAAWKAEKERRKDIVVEHALDDTALKVFGDMAVATGRFVISETSKGRTTRFRGRFVHVWQKRNGSWLVAADHWYPADALPQKRTAVVVDSASLSAFAGRYDMTDGPIAQVTPSSEGLVLTFENDPSGWKPTFVPESANEFFVRDDDLQLVFLGDARARDVKLLFVDHGRVSRGKKVP